MTPTTEPCYRAAGPALLRMPLRSFPRPSTSTGTTPAELLVRLKSLTDDPLLMEAVELANPALADSAVADPQALSPKALRSTVLAMNAYAARLSGRATPYGVFAGVARASYTGPARAELGPLDAHRKHVRPDAGWLARRATELSCRAGLQPAVGLTTNPLVRLRAGRAAITAPGDLATETGRAPREAAVRLTPPVRAVLDAARAGTTGAEAVRAAVRAGATEHAAARLLTSLVKARFLLSGLQPTHLGDPLGDLTARLEALGASEAEPLRALAGRLRRYASEPLGARGRRARPGAAATAPEPPPHVDTLLDARVDVGPLVRQEAEQAALVLARLAGPSPGRALHTYLVRRYGTGRSVPLRELEDALDHLEADPPPAENRARDAALVDAYAAALRSGSPEVELTDDLLDAVAPADDGLLPHDFDLYALICAPDTSSLDTGDFRLVLRGVPAAAGAGNALARFADAMGPPGRSALAGIRRAVDETALAGAEPGAVTADLVFQPLPADALNVARVTRTRAHRIAVNTVDEDGAYTLIDPARISLHATPERVVVWADDLDREVAPLPASALSPHFTAPPAARVLAMAAAGRRAPAPFDWGPLRDAGRLPRLRRGRTVYVPQSWRLPLPRDAARSDDRERERRFARWRGEHGVPRHVMLADSDRGIPLDLDDPLDRLWLHSRPGGSVLLQEIDPDAAGWLTSGQGPHLAECVFPMVRTAQAPHRPSHSLREPACAAEPIGGRHLRLTLTGPPAGLGAVLDGLARGPLSGLPGGIRCFHTHTPDGSGLDLVLGAAEEVGRERALRRVYEEIAHHRTDGPAPTVSVHEYRRDAGFGGAVLFPEEAEAWAEADSSAALAVRAAAGAPVARDDLTVLSAVDLTWHLDAALPKADRSDDGHLDWMPAPDRRAFAARRRAMWPYLVGSPDWQALVQEGRAAVVERWRDRDRAAIRYLERVPEPQRRSVAQLLMRVHATRSVGPAAAPRLLATAAAAEYARLSWLRATRNRPC
ncbi:MULTISPECIES: lantibiotic dehydratase family protein [unclassified Streptomyces]|uniref:lantibiotic dehydratase family protein n=1 Tax=unclassified Streptomyces TaxID=2593676 RepID=UPI002ED512FD|nr:lantibiotic dehydratase family protein [Streptomyces sp. NBC_00891]WSY07446.1 lantibiotic dehydratase family protein [Streptomyces sp. NBC_00890]WSZ09071.1 lantibiotic dehydratase family protein [Streptomyces sp. NBC_00869]WSZ23430.1 lantibiotic dehydratase family protein [Streptomyces sp. NBC_00870]